MKILLSTKIHFDQIKHFSFVCVIYNYVIENKVSKTIKNANYRVI